MTSAQPTIKVVVVGCGLGGLACAIACAREGLEVLILERAPQFLPIGAGIQVPPNSMRVNRWLGTAPKLMGPGVTVRAINYRRFADGQVLYKVENAERDEAVYGAPWLVIHRADYLDILHDTALALGVKIHMDAEVSDIDFENTTVKLKASEEVIQADVVVGADGLWSTFRNAILQKPSPPEETGDLAYRGTFTKAQLQALNDPSVEELCARTEANVWLGPHKHAVFYPLKNGEQYNLVLIRPDNIHAGRRQEQGDVSEMRATFSGWDPVLEKIVSCLESALKWKLCHHKELEVWTQGSATLLGDACHPTLPYQAQGAAMAVEDGAVLGLLLGRLTRAMTDQGSQKSLIPDVLKLYESLRKKRTTVNVAGATANQYWYHLPDGLQQQERDKAMKSKGVGVESKWNLLNKDYQKDLLGFDVIKNAEEAFDAWLRGRTKAQL